MNPVSPTPLRATAALLFLNLVVPAASAALLGSWSLDEPAGKIADSTGTHPDGFAFTGARYASDGVPDGTYGALVVTGSTGKSAGFGIAKGQYFEIGADNNTPILNIAPTGSLTAMGWINIDGANTGSNYMIGTGGALGPDRGWRLGLRSLSADGANATVRFTGYGVLDNDSEPIQVTYGTWMHIAATYSNGTIRYFVNGTQLTGATSLDTSLFQDETTNGRLTIGARRGGTSSDQCNGRLDGVRVYNTVLTEAEIQAAALESLAPATVTTPPPWHWTGAAGTEWSTIAANWDAGIWINGFDAVLDAAGGGNMTIPVSVFPHSLTVTGAGNWNLTGNLVGVSGYGPVTMNGTGTLTLNSITSTAGPTTVNSGTLEVLALHGLSAGAPLTVGPNGTLSGTGPFASSLLIQGTLSPGGGASHKIMALPVTFQSGSTYRWECAVWNGTVPGTDYDSVTAAPLTLTATPAQKLTVAVTGTPADFTEADKTFTIATSTEPITGFDAASAVVSVSGFTGTGQWALQLDGTGTQLLLAYTAGSGGGTPFALWAAAKGLTGAAALPAADPDADGFSNQLEYALGSEPASAASRGYAEVFTTDTNEDGRPELILTLAVQSGVNFNGAASPAGTSADSLTYTIQGSTDLATFTAPVEGPLAIPAVPPGWSASPPDGYTWQSFRLSGSNGLPGKGWLRAVTTIGPIAAE